MVLSTSNIVTMLLYVLQVFSGTPSSWIYSVAHFSAPAEMGGCLPC